MLYLDFGDGDREQVHPHLNHIRRVWKKVEIKRLLLRCLQIPKRPSDHSLRHTKIILDIKPARATDFAKGSSPISSIIIPYSAV